MSESNIPPQICDSVLRYIADGKGALHQSRALIEMGITDHQRRAAVNAITTYSPDFFRTQILDGRTQLVISHTVNTALIAEFLSKGGFTALHEASEKRKIQEQQEKQRDSHKRELEIQALERQAAENLRTRRLSIAALILAAIAIILDLIKWLSGVG